MTQASVVGMKIQPLVVGMKIQPWTCPGFVEPFDKMDSRHWEKLDEISKFKQIS